MRKISSEFFEEKINHNRSFSEFFKTEAINLKELNSCFQHAIISVLAIYTPRDLRLLLEH